MSNQHNPEVAFEAPGIESRWTSIAKEGVGTFYHTGCRLWFTLSFGNVGASDGRQDLMNNYKMN